MDDARDDDDDEEDERVVGTLGDRSPSFSAAAARAKTLARVSNENKLRLYALYKQATAGPCASPKPRLVDGMTAHAKWTAWRDLGETLSSRDAATEYVRLVEELSGGDARTKARAEAATGAEFDIADIDGEGDTIGFGGPVFSRPAMPGDPRDVDRSRTPPSDDQGVDGGSPRRRLDAGLEALAEASWRLATDPWTLLKLAPVLLTAFAAPALLLPTFRPPTDLCAGVPWRAHTGLNEYCPVAAGQNQLTRLPDWISELQALRELHLSDNL